MVVPEINDCGWEPLSDNNLISFVTTGKVLAVVTNEMDEINYETCEDLQERKIFPSEALDSLIKLKKYMETGNFLPEEHMCLEGIKYSIEQRMCTLSPKYVNLWV